MYLTINAKFSNQCFKSLNSQNNIQICYKNSPKMFHTKCQFEGMIIKIAFTVYININYQTT